MELVAASPARIVCVGEAMLELSSNGDSWALASGGDTLNTAIHLARAGHDVAFFTALGGDPFSATMRREWAGEGLDCSLVLDHPSRLPGLYAISVDPSGERSFSYWRDNSAARAMFALPETDTAVDVAATADLLIFSLISLAILPPEGRDRLFALAQRVRERGGKVAFDGNYRSRLWSTPDEAKDVRDRAIRVADIGLPTLSDEAMLSGESDADAVAAHWRRLGCAETVVKLGAAGCRLADGRLVVPPLVVAPVDTSGAGDAFNAGYLGARLAGSEAFAAAEAGHRLARWTIMRPGAIPRRS